MYNKNTNNLPYFKTKPVIKEKSLANFLLRKFRPKIKERFSVKNKQKIKRIGKNKSKTGQSNIKGPSLNLGFDPYRSYQKLILEQLKQLTNSVEKLERKITKLERKLEERKRPKNQGKQ